MAQYCRYCAWLVTGNGTYCTAHEKEMPDKACKRTNKCKDFELNPMDAYAENLEGYKPRRAKKTVHKIKEFNLFDKKVSK